MKVSLNWIRDYVDLPTNLDMKELAHNLTMRTVEVEGYENPSHKLNNIVVARVEKLESHPNADKLRVCQCNIGKEDLVQIVCGGSNLYEGELVVLALPGAEVVWHGEGEPVKIKSGKLRGVASEGMICASTEIGLEDIFPLEEEHQIVDLSKFPITKFELGMNIAEALDLDDIIIEIDNKSMTHRPDLWGHYGLARELAAIYKLELKPITADRAIYEKINSFENLEKFDVEVENKELCRRYLALLLDNVEVKESPYWLKKRLMLCGLRSINNIVDLSNYVMLATGQPTHTFDADKVNGKIVVRNAKEKEKLLLLDSKELELSTADLIIADEDKAIALAGIMGGKNDSIFPDTSRVILEIASFDPMTVRKTQQRYQQRTESSTRFEKNIDTARVDLALEFFIDTVQKLGIEADYKKFSNNVFKPTEANTIVVDKGFLETRSGHQVDFKLLTDTLERLEFKLEDLGESRYKVEAPIFRSTGDVEGPYDILEEMSRMIGYENFSFVAPQIDLNQAIQRSDIDMRRSISEYMAFDCGFDEVVTYPWIHERFQKLILPDFSRSIPLEAAPSPETRMLRQSLVPGLIAVTEHNAKFLKEFKIFESSQVFNYDNEEIKQTRELATLIYCNLEDVENSFRELKSVVVNMPKASICECLDFARVQKPFGADIDVWLNIVNKNLDRRHQYSEDEVIGNIYLLASKAHKEADIKKMAMLVLDLNLDKMHILNSRTNKYLPVPAIAPVEENLSMLVDDEVEWKDIEKSINNKVDNLEFIEEYRGKQIPEGKKSIHFSFTLSGKDGSLTMEEIDQRMKKVIKILEKDLGASLRY